MSKRHSTDMRFLQDKSRNVRQKILEAVACAGKGHLGGALSVTDILVSLIFGGFARVGLTDSVSDLILSKGHAGVALYAALSEYGVIELDLLNSLNQNSRLGEHPDRFIPGVSFCTGSLGHGIGLGSGVALARKFDDRTQSVFVVMGDGECYEGSVWEAAIFASGKMLSNLCVVIDRNGLITHGATEDIMPLNDLDQKWRSFGWDVFNVDGHSLLQLSEFFSARQSRLVSGQQKKPCVLLANTIKGKGVSFMENVPAWHHGGFQGNQLESALKEVSFLGRDIES